MKFVCYRAKDLNRYSYFAKWEGVTIRTSDLAGVARNLSGFARTDKDVEGFYLTGKLSSSDIETSMFPNPEGLPKRVLEELALIISNKSKREVLVQ